MELKQLKVFITVCEYMNITEASKILNYSQSTISDIIQKLELSLSVTLFDRIKKRIYLTDKGKILLAYANKIIALQEEAFHAITDSKTTLNVGITESLCVYKFPTFFRTYLEEHKNITFNFVLARCEEIPDLLRENKIDIGMTIDEILTDKDISSTPLFKEEIILIKSGNYHKKEITTYSDLDAENIIISKGITGYNILFFDIYKSNNINVGPITYMESIEGIKSYVKDGFGISFMPYTAVEAEIHAGTIAPITINKQRYFHTVQLLTYKSKQLSLEAKDLLEACINKFKEPSIS